MVDVVGWSWMVAKHFPVVCLTSNCSGDPGDCRSWISSAHGMRNIYTPTKRRVVEKQPVILLPGPISFNTSLFCSEKEDRSS